MSFQTFLQTLGAAAHLDVAAAAQSGGCTIRFGEQMEVVFEHEADRDVVEVFGTVVTVTGMAPEVRSRLCEALLQLHLFGLATDGSYFGFDPQLGRVILFRSVPLAAGDPEAVAAVESFVNQLERWQKGLLDYVGKLGQATAAPPVMYRA
jgi:hypothetical protein